jgi:hypothetical protein
MKRRELHYHLCGLTRSPCLHRGHSSNESSSEPYSPTTQWPWKVRRRGRHGGRVGLAPTIVSCSPAAVVLRLHCADDRRGASLALTLVVPAGRPAHSAETAAARAHGGLAGRAVTRTFPARTGKAKPRRAGRRAAHRTGTDRLERRIRPVRSPQRRRMQDCTHPPVPSGRRGGLMPEVRQGGIAGLAYQHVGGLDVTVDETRTVHFGEPCGDHLG